MRGPVAALVVLMSASPLDHPNGRLLREARNGRVRGIRDIILKTPLEYLDLDAALSVAASRAHVHAMAMLVDFGAADLNRWLTDEARGAPADAFDLAREAASAMDSTDAEWLLVSLKRTDERKRRGREWDL